jgi:hypothetical protein
MPTIQTISAKKLNRLAIKKETLADLDVQNSEQVKGGTIQSTPPHCPPRTKTTTIAPPPPIKGLAG